MVKFLFAFFLAIIPMTAHAAESRAVFAMGCFWCAEHDMQTIPGVLRVISGYTGGTVENPTYEQVSAGGTGHFEAIEVAYDPARVSYRNLLDYFWRNIDPFDGDGQFCDTGDQYRAAIFVNNDGELREAEASKLRVEKLFPGQKVTALILPATTFYPAETYHQDFSETNPLKYKFYRIRCGRDQRLEQVWGKS